MKIITCLVSIFTSLAITINIDAQTEKTTTPLTKGEPVKSTAENKPAAPAFNLTSLDGKTFDLTSLRGKVVVLNFWFTGCPPCLTEIPKLNELVEKFKHDDVVFIAPTLDETRVLTTFLKEHPFKYNIVPNSSDLILGTYGDGTGNLAMPTHIVIDKEGDIDTKIVGGLIGKDGNTLELDNLSNAIARLCKK